MKSLQDAFESVETLMPILAVFFLITFVISFIILYKLTNIHKISIPLNITLTISLFLPLSTTYLLPIDMATPSNSLLLNILWKTNYWITFFATWIILPFWQYFLSSGKFTLIQRIKHSAFSVLKFLLFLFVIGLIFLVYVLIYHRDSLNFKFLKSLLITTSHIYSLSMAIWLMVHGLIHLPKHFWSTSYSKNLNDDYIKLPELQIHLEDSKFELRDVCNKINSLNELLNIDSNINTQLEVSMRDHIFYLGTKIPEEFRFDRNLRSSNNNYQFLIDSIGIPVNKINDDYLSKLNEELKWKTWDYQHSKSIFEHKILDIIYLEDIVNYLNNSTFNSSFDNTGNLEIEWRNYRTCWPRWVFIYFWPIVYKIFAICFAIVGAIIIESEMLHGTRMSIMSWIIKKNDSFDCLKMVFILVIMMSCSLISLSLVKLFNIYKVEFNSNSDPVSSIFFISYALRLTIPLGYNFLMLLNSDVTSNSAFLVFVSGNLELIKIGEVLNDVIPRLVLIPVLMSFFGIWGKLRRLLDGYFLFDYILDELDFEDVEGSTPTNNDIESVVGSTNKTAALLQEGRSITQRYVSNGIIPLNDSLSQANSRYTSTSNFTTYTNNAIAILLFPFRLFQNVTRSIITNASGFLRSNDNANQFNIDSDVGDTSTDGLRRYNLIGGGSNGGIILESRRNSQVSEQSRISGVSGLSGDSGTQYDADNRVLGDEYISNIE